MLSILIVNYHAEDLLRDCLSLLFRHTQNIPFEVLVIDNGSTPEKRQALEASFAARWIDMGYNAGFARANNEGMRQGAGDTFLLLNPDVLIMDDVISKHYHRFQKDAFVASGIQLLNADGSPQISGSYFIKGGINHLLPLPVWGRLAKIAGNLLGARQTSLKEASDLREVDWINGAYLMVSRDVAFNSGLMDEDFFLYAEEIEWCSRLGRQGKLAVYGDLHAIHLQGEVANESFGSAGKGYYNLYDKKGRQLMVSNFLRIRKQFGAGWFMVHLFFYLSEVPLMFLWAMLPGTNLRIRQWLGYCKNLAHLLGLSGNILFRKRHFYKLL